jgi:hypothetical protein
MHHVFKQVDMIILLDVKGGPQKQGLLIAHGRAGERERAKQSPSLNPKSELESYNKPRPS